MNSYNKIDLLKFINDIPNINYDPLRYILNNNLLDASGLVIEFGCWKGQTLDMISDFTENNVYGFDTFEGVNVNWESIDMNKFNVNNIPKKVEKLDKFYRHKTTGQISTFNKNVIFIKGLFENTLPKFLLENNKEISFMHIDCDIYSSTKTIFNNCCKYIKNDCIIVFDELVNYPGFENGESKAFLEWVNENNITFNWIGMNGVPLSYNELNLLDSLNINKEYIIDNMENIDWFKKARILNIRFSVAVKIINNPTFNI
tara:strand:- start:474 stop:1247 length:774 start_codon:yes stop_codon:yes gene_type:complete